MTDKVKLIYNVSLFHYHFTWEKKLLMDLNNLQDFIKKLKKLAKLH